MKNFIIRLFTAIAIVAVQVLCTYLSPYSFAGLFLLLTALAVNEFLKILSHGGQVQISRPLMIVGSSYLFFAFWLNSLTGFSMLVLFVPYLLFLLYCYIRELFSNNSNPISNLGAMMLSQTYVVVPLSLVNLLAFSHYDCFSASAPFYAIPLTLYVFIWLNDTGAYLTGTLFGKHRLYPRISPKKSWEGAVGGALFTMASAVVVAHLCPFLTVWQWVGMALVVVVFGTLGDLTESMIKRYIGIKDSGHILPGHGGILDRLDSMLFAIPAVIVYLHILSLC
ncbi:MAG: phosphatidate cytidylyltransferase [Bacteroidaceae bacterium]|nr:phosphatidate cytidylyltransferase [Bacteroidaceae bacterium]